MDKFNKIVLEIFKLTPDQITDSLSAKDIPSWDSMNYLLFIAELEKQFSVSFNMDEVLNADTLGEVKAMLQTRGISL